MLKDGDIISSESETDEQRALQFFNNQLLTITQEHIANNNNVKSAATCQKVWTYFSQRHRKSPTHVNNNVQECSKIRKYESIPVCRKLYQSKDAKKRATTVNVLGAKFQKIWSCTAAFLLQFILFSFFIVNMILTIFVVILLFYSIVVLHKPSQTLISRNTQDLISPFMRGLRIASLPFIRQFPTFTNLYEESCLVSNPFFDINTVDCWPCETVRHVPDLTGFSNFSTFYHHGGIPFIVKDALNSTVDIEDLKQILLKSPEIWSKSTDFNLSSITSITKLLEDEKNMLTDFHVAWKINRVTIARQLRDYFPKPYFIPATTEVSVQHYLFLDNLRSPRHTLPITEFANVFLTQASGSRNVVLIPTEKCHQKCRVVSTVLRPKDVLFYNWLFWRPMSVPVESSNLESSTSVTYLGSFY